MATELEAKFAVESFTSVRKMLKTSGAVYLGKCEEYDEFFDTPDRAFYSSRSALRLRRIKILRGVAGGKQGGWLLTMKGSKKPRKRVKIRQETQTVVADGEAVRSIFEALGLQIYATLAKKRASYRLGKCLVELDDLSGLGKFVEIEGPSERQVELVRRKLQLPDEPNIRSYLAMVTEKKTAS